MAAGCALLMMGTGCSPEKAPLSSPGSPVSETALSGSLSVYAEKGYQTALERVFRTLNLRHPLLDMQWADTPAGADIVITDRLPAEEAGQYRTLDNVADPLRDVLIPELVLRDERGVLGLPLFLRCDSYWYDTLLYQKIESAVPYSLESFRSSPLLSEFPVVCDIQGMEHLFWSTAAPVYLSAGGTEEELSVASFRPEPLLAALKRIRELTDGGMLSMQENAQSRFTSDTAMFWITDVHKIAGVLNRMPNLSDISFAPTLVYTKTSAASLVVRADFVTVRQQASPVLAEFFLRTLYENKTLVNLTIDTKIPLACRLSFGTNSVPELVAACYTILASPSLQLFYLPCRWDASVSARIEAALSGLASASLTPEEAVQRLCP